MIKWVKDITIIATAAMMLSACSSSSDENQAAQLPVFEASYHPHVAWTQSVGNGIGDYFFVGMPQMRMPIHIIDGCR